MDAEVEALYRSAVARFDAGDGPSALAHCQRILEAEPAHAAALNLLGVLLAERLDHAGAVAAFSRSLEVRAHSSSAWHNLANSLDQLGRLDEARAAYAKACELDPALVEAQFELAALGGAAAPAAAPARYVERFFDAFAERYDEHLAGLADQGPALIGQALRQLGPARARYPVVVDLGCGTGRASAVLRPLTERLIGVDLAPAMLAKAQDLGTYDQLVCAELLSYLERSPGSADLLVAADVFTYLGDLEPVLGAARRALKADGIVIFSVEAAAEPTGYELDRSRRYRHSLRYLENAAKLQGFSWKSQPVRLRVEPAGPVQGFVFVLEAG
ncbi:MAG: methyltransferase domain-containing protein [Pirellulales bacterium]